MTTRSPALALLLLLALAPAGCQDDDDDLTHTVGDFEVLLHGQSFDIRRPGGAALLEGLTGSAGSGAAALPAPLGWRTVKPDVREAMGMYLFLEQAPEWSGPAEGDTLQVISATRDKLELSLGDARVTLTREAAKALRVSWSLVGAAKAANRLVQSFACAADERFFGAGARVHGTEHRGERIPNWVSEQGIGKLRKASPFAGYPLQGDVHDTYLPVPVVLSSRGFGLLVENSRRSQFHLCTAATKDRWAVEVQHDALSYLLIDGPEPTDVLERLTAKTGRPRLPPAWAFAPWIDAVHGPTQVKAVAVKLRAEKIPAGAIWTEDWIGGSNKLGGFHLNYQWHADTTLYPDLKGLADSLHAQGFRFLGYFNAFITQGSQQWQEAAAKGHAIKDAAGKQLSFIGPLLEQNTLPDLTRAAAVKWLQGYFAQAEQLGFDGWMADYGEWLPLAARLSDGTTGEAAHNLYPVQWQQANRSFWDKARPNGDYLFFVRSGWTGTGGAAPFVWAGDQQTEFSGLDGLASVVPLMVNAGMSGIPIMTHDIGGYSTVGAGVAPTTKELFYRWCELGAFSPVMRTHHGAMADKNWAWDEDAATTAHFAAYARAHVALFPYRYTLAKQASDTGLPMVRHLALHYPDDPKAAAVSDQFMLGPSLLVAPVLKDKARSRQVYLPGAGTTWFDYTSGARYDGGKTHTIKAGLEAIPIFAPAGAIVPVLETKVDTLDRVSAPGIVDLDDAEQGPLVLQVYLSAYSTLTLYDGTRVGIKGSAPSTVPTIQLTGSKTGSKTLPICSASLKSDCVESNGASSITVHLSATRDATFVGTCPKTMCFNFGISGAPRARAYKVIFRW